MKQSLWIALAAIILFGLFGSAFVVREDQTGMVLNLGRVVRSDLKPGLHFKIPVVETARVFDRRFKVLNTAAARAITAEQKDVSVDFFAIGYISNVADFYRAHRRRGNGGRGTAGADHHRLVAQPDQLAHLAATGAGRPQRADRRAAGRHQRCDRSLGMQITDLRIKQIDLPSDSQIINDVYERTRAQRKQEASKLRAEGEEQSLSIRAQADRESTVIVADAERDAQ